MIIFQGEAVIAKTPTTTANKNGDGHTSFLFVATERPDKDGEPITIHLPVVYFDELPAGAAKDATVALQGHLNRRRHADRYETELVVDTITVLNNEG